MKFSFAIVFAAALQPVVGATTNRSSSFFLPSNSTVARSSLRGRDLQTASTLDSGKSVVNNIGYILRGYDTVKGNPLDTSGMANVDHGYRQPIFDVSSTGYELMPDLEHYTPKSINVLECEGCNMDFSTRVLDTSQAYVNSLSAKVSVQGRVGGFFMKGSFSASQAYQSSTDRFFNKHEVSTESEVSCCVYQAELQAYNMPPYSQNFLAAVKRMTDVQNDSDRLRQEVRLFVQNFGTHYVSKATMGSLFGEQSFLSKEAASQKDSQGNDITVQATMSGWIASGSVDASLTTKNAAASEFRKKTTQRSVYSRGAKPPVNGDINQWLQDSSKNPLPTYIEVQAIVDLDVFNGKTKVLEALKSALSGYCQEVGQCDVPSGTQHVTSVGELASQKTTAHYPELVGGGHHRFASVPDGIEESILSNAWVYTGLRGDFSNDGTNIDKHYYSIIADFRDPNHMENVEYGNNGQWTGLDEHFWIGCPAGKAIVGMSTKYNYQAQDRQFRVKCASFANMDIAHYGWKPSGLQMTNGWADLPVLNNYGESLNYNCPRNHVMLQMESIHDNGSRDRIFKIMCGLVRGKPTPGTSKLTPHINDYTRNFVYWTLNSAVFKGIVFTYDHSSKDKAFKFVELGLPAGVTTTATGRSGWLRNDFVYSCPGGKVITGFESAYTNSGSNRSYKIQCSAIRSYNILDQGGAVVNAGAQYSHDFFSGFRGAGSSATLECPNNQVMTGVRNRWDYNAGGAAFSILCNGFTNGAQ
ncbi:MAC Perforin domain containing protein [Seminavis robusta]|uniref:MAC Perforin domain containing protein n=1 Tax=Seminavis robusta TaxID=568900 RepID=A0A9N8DT10_9STRA|nr:MAC Perforin domain containing protein [Seminavis robusta]|eukprot:Sro335_g119960.1 MAC Perforin domain containing protein (753) ;mRNA; f:930-3835